LKHLSRSLLAKAKPENRQLLRFEAKLLASRLEHVDDLLHLPALGGGSSGRNDDQNVPSRLLALEPATQEQKDKNDPCESFPGQT